MQFPEKVSAVTHLLAFLSWKRLFQLFLIVVFLIAVVLATLSFSFFKKPTILKEDQNIKLLTISQTVAKKLSDANKRETSIVGIQIVTLNFYKNIRVETYISISDGVIQDAYNSYASSKLFETPIFTPDKVNNNRILHIINGEFICVPYKESTAYKYAPSLDQSFITDVCAIGIPPYSTDASGILTIYLKNHPTDDERLNLFLFARNISVLIFNDSK